MERVQSGPFIEFKEFLAVNVLLVQRLQELNHSRAHMSPLSQTLMGSSLLRKITDPFTWASWFLTFMATSLELWEACNQSSVWDDHSPAGLKARRDGVATLQLSVLSTELLGPPMLWVDFNPSLMAATVLGQAGDGSSLSCPLCL